MKKFLFLTYVLTIAFNAMAAIQTSQTLPTEGKPEHCYTIANAQGYYCNATTSPTRNAANYAKFAFYESDKDDSYYIYNMTANKWVSYQVADQYSPKQGFVSMTDAKQTAAIYKITEISGGAFEIQPYTTTGVASVYLNWFQGVGNSNPEDGTVTLGLWTDNGAQDAGSRWFLTEVGVKHNYILFSDGMPSSATVTINGQVFKGLNAQGNQSITIEGDLRQSDVKVSVGGGSIAKVTIDNLNYQIDVKFIQFFTPTNGIEAEKKYPYLLQMPMAYIKMTGNNLHHTTKRSEADKFIMIESESQGHYFIYDLSAKCYLTYINVANGSSQTLTNESYVRYTKEKSKASTWQMYYLSEQSVAILPSEITNPTASSPSLNFTGGIDYGCVLNLWRADDSNSAWKFVDPSVGSIPCATLMYALPGAPYMHKLTPNEGEKVIDVDLQAIPTLSLKEDRIALGNKYKFVSGTAPTNEGEYVYTVKTKGDNGGEETLTKVRLIVDAHMQSPTPMMSWLTWNWFAHSIAHDKIIDIAKGMQKYGLIDAGFNSIVLDDTWAKQTTDKNDLTYDASKFPDGITGLKTALKKINPQLKVGIYSDAGSMTCENYQPGSYGHEAQHIALFDSWGVDMLKYDYCNREASTQVSYSRMGKVITELNKTRKAKGETPFVFNICEWGKTQPWTWGAEAGGSSWRATSDAREDWIGNNSRPGVIGGVDEVRRLWMYAGVNRFNDLDMMCIGLHGLGGPSNNTATHQQNGGKINGLTDSQARTQMSLWCMLASPLALTCDLRETPKGEANSIQDLPTPLITNADIETLTNKEILAINQDALGQQAEYMESLSTGKVNYSSTGYDVYVKDLTGGRMAVSVTNRSGSMVEIPALKLINLYLKADTKYDCHEIWSKTDTQIENELVVGSLKAYETKVYVLATHKGDDTAIKNIVGSLQTNNETPRYDLSGRIVNENFKGVSIKNEVKTIRL